MEIHSHLTTNQVQTDGLHEVLGLPPDFIIYDELTASIKWECHVINEGGGVRLSEPDIQEFKVEGKLSIDYTHDMSEEDIEKCIAAGFDEEGYRDLPPMINAEVVVFSSNNDSKQPDFLRLDFNTNKIYIDL